MKIFFLFSFSLLCFMVIHAQSDPAPKPPPEDFIGKYVFPQGSVVPQVDVALSGSSLVMTSVAGSSSLAEIGVDSFQVIEFSGIAVFKRGDDKKVNGVHIEAGGYVLDGQKQLNGAWIYNCYYRPDKNDQLLLRN